jgi:hypothetical protein
MRNRFGVSILVATALIGTAQAQRSVTTEVRTVARKLAHAWVDTSSAQTLDQLANRTIAFAGMVPGILVVIDGRKMDAGRALIASGLTIIKSNDNDADANAMRNAVYILMEIAKGKTKRP